MLTALAVEHQGIGDLLCQRVTRMLADQVQAQIESGVCAAGAEQLAVFADQLLDLQIDLREALAELAGKRPVGGSAAPVEHAGLGKVGERLLILLVRFGLKLILTPLACAGRMAFTNYLSQTLIMTTIFYGGRGLGWYGQIGWPEMWMIIGGVWAAQLIWSPLWLSVFQMGPLEWAWRCLTYKRMVPLRKR